MAKLKSVAVSYVVFAVVILMLCFVSVSFSESETNVYSDTEWEEEEPDVAANYKATEGMKKLVFKQPNLTDEDNFSIHMPQYMKCDGCRVVAFVMTRKLANIQGRYKKGHRLLESDVIDLLDEICANEETFESYGVKEVDGKIRLSGEGLETSDAPGFMQGGGKWPFRLRQMCQEYTGEFGEDVIYETFLKDQKESLKKLFCYNEETGNICGSVEKKKSKKKAKSTKEEL